MNHQPKITVFMAVYNGEKYLKEAINSILHQTFKNFELLIINDGSTDKSIQIIESYDDPRIRLLHNEKNMGIVKTRNRGIKESREKYIAIMDQDDISLPRRLAKQVEFMENHPEIGVLGTWTKVLKQKYQFIARYYPNHDEIKASLIFSSTMAHPSIMLRKEALEKHGFKYNNDFKTEDYELWTRMIDHTKFANLQKTFLVYRKHEGSICDQGSSTIEANTMVIRLKLLEYLGLSPTKEEINLHQTICQFKIKHDISFINQCQNWLIKIKKANNVAKIYQDKALKKILADKWLTTCDLCSSLGLISYKIYRNSALSKGLNYDLHNNLRMAKFLTKCLLKR